MNDTTEHQLSYLVHQSKMNAAITAEEFAIVASIKPRLFRDDNQWCMLWGENLRDGVAGFGDSPILAMYDFNKSWSKKII